MSDESQRPGLADAIADGIELALADLRVAEPGRVVSYDAAKKKCSVQPLIRRVRYVDGERTTELAPIVHEVPVSFPGGGGFRVVWPIPNGSTVLLVYADASLDRWAALGGEVDPEDDRAHHPSDAIAIPGVQPFAGQGADGMHASGAVIEFDDGSHINIGGTSPLVLLSTLQQFMTVLDSVSDSAGACAALKAALEAVNWPNAFVATKARGG